MNVKEARRMASMDRVCKTMFDKIRARAMDGHYELSYSTDVKYLPALLADLELEGFVYKLDDKEGQTYRTMLISWVEPKEELEEPAKLETEPSRGFASFGAKRSSK